MKRAALIIAIATQFIGKKEKPGNKGFFDAAFQKLMVAVGWLTGQPWCAYFTKLVWKEAYANSPELYKLVNRLCNGGALATLNNHIANGKFKVTMDPIPGSIVIWQHGDSTKGHAGILEKYDGDNTLTVIEGNTNASGSREGDQVARKPRTLKRPFTKDGLNLKGFINPIED